MISYEMEISDGGLIDEGINYDYIYLLPFQKGKGIQICILVYWYSYNFFISLIMLA